MENKRNKHRLCGIYCITIGGKKYIGKDTNINKGLRIQRHKFLLAENAHYNKHLQNAYNKHKELHYSVLAIGEIDDKTLCEMEKYFIQKYGTFHNGYNMTKGGEGMSGYKRSTESKLKVQYKSANNNAQAKISKEDFKVIVSMLLSGATNSEIAKQFNLHSRYVSLIRHKKRHILWWKEVGNPDIAMSNGRFRKLNATDLAEIHDLLSVKTNKEIAKIYEVDPSTISRLRTPYKRKRKRE